MRSCEAAEVFNWFTTLIVRVTHVPKPMQ